MKMKMPIINSSPKIYINKDLLNEEWAMKNHSQTLDRLAERGGLSCREVLANVKKVPFIEIGSISTCEALKLVERLAIKSLD